MTSLKLLYTQSTDFFCLFTDPFVQGGSITIRSYFPSSET